MAVEEATPETAKTIGEPPPGGDLVAEPETTALIDLDVDPFGEGPMEGEQVAGPVSSILQRLMRRKAPEVAPKPITEEAGGTVIEGTVEDAPQLMEPPAPLPPGTKPPAPPDVETFEQPMEVLTGTTRDLPNINYYESPETQKLLGLLHKQAVRPPSQSNEETRALARELKTITGKRPALNWTPEEMTAIRMSLNRQGKDLMALRDSILKKKRNGLEPSSEELADFELKSRQFVATSNAVAGLSTETGRLLQSLQIVAESESAYYREIARAIEGGGGADLIMEKIAATEGAKDLKSLSKAIRETWPQKAWRWLLTARYNLMLSSTRTHFANIAGSAVAGTWETTIIDPLAKIVNYAERTQRVLGGGKFTTPGDITTMPWVGGDILGLARGARDGLALAGRMSVGAQVPPGSYQGKFVNELGMRYKPQDVPDSVLGKALTTPTRLLEAEDAFFRSAYYHKRLYGLAAARAQAEAGSDRKLFQQLYRSYLDDPPDDLRAQAKEYSQRLTFTNDPSIYGKYLQGLAQGANRLRQWGPMHLLLPFVRTPANLFGYTMQQSGFGHMLAPSATWQAIRGTDPRARADAIARITAAVGMHVLLYEYWLEGKITGVGSSSPQATRLMQSAGWRANAVRVEDKYYEVNRLDPMGSTLALVATAHDFLNEDNLSAQDKTAAAGAVILKIADMMTDRTYLSSLGTFIEAMQSGSVNQFFSLLGSTATSMVLPNILRDVREADDPYRREQAIDPKQGIGFLTRFQKSVMNGLPAYSQELPVALDWRGEPITNAGGPLWRAMVPIRVADFEDVPETTRELVLNNITPGKPRSQMSVPNGRGMFTIGLLSLDDGRGHIYSYYQQLVGQHRERLVSKLIGMNSYKKLIREGKSGTPDSEAGRMLQKVINRGHDRAKLEMLKALDEGRTVTLYKGHEGAEMTVELPEISLRENINFMKEYLKATEEDRDTMEPPEGLIVRPPKAGPQVEKLFPRPAETGPRF